uniref:Uncharacterized protein n=1 Tax=Tetraselmis sp. GSL018 TaxID=582737 RepID=A0A061QZK3_9CHLO|mmetsp:Transcript_23574/g.56366  ORF Transcript_23574/g.56366 Transcript_23574/m.56366 type:complete len:695 (+) Transcript_23574:192-2276(+)
MPQTLNCSRGLHSCCRHSERVCRNASGLSPSVLPSLRGFGGYGLRSDINSKAVATCRLRHKSQLAAFGPLSSVFTAAAASDRSVIHVPVTWSQLLGVSVNDQDVNPEEVLAAFRELDGPEQAAFSAEAWASRREILLEARDRLLSSGTSKAADEISVGASRAKGLLLVLTELGFFEEVVRLEAEAAEGPMARALQDTDCRLALAMAHCGIAEELAGGSDKDSVSTGFLHMEAALEHLRGTGKASIAPSLAAIVQQSMEDMRPKFIVEQLKDPNSVVEREQLLGVVKDLLSREEPAKGIDSSFARGALGALTAEETIAVCSDWEPRRVPSLPWYFPRALERVAAAYAVKGFAQRSPALIAKAEQISALEESDTARACRAICQVLLGSKADAVGTLRQTSSWDSSMDDTEAMEELSNFTKQWLKHVGWKQFRKSEAMTNVPLSLVAYFTSPALLLLTLPFGRKLMRAAVAVQWMLDSLPFKRLPGREATEGALTRRAPAQTPQRALLTALSAGLLAVAATAAAVTAVSKGGLPGIRVPVPASFVLPGTGGAKEHGGQTTGAMGAAEAERIIRAWQGAKAEAFGKEPTPEPLATVLVGHELRRWQSRVRDAQRSSVPGGWDYQTLKTEVHEVMHSAGANQAKVLVDVWERAVPNFAGSSPVISSSYEARYKVECHMKRTDEGSPWRITKFRVLEDLV